MKIQNQNANGKNITARILLLFSISRLSIFHIRKKCRKPGFENLICGICIGYSRLDLFKQSQESLGVVVFDFLWKLCRWAILSRDTAKKLKFHHIFCWENFWETDTFPMTSQMGNGNVCFP